MALADDPFRLCVDLNVWVSNFLTAARGLRGAASREIVGAVQDGRSGVGPIQLVVSHAMLTRLSSVLTKKGASLDFANRYISIIENISILGPCYEFPHVVLGGGFIPTRDALMSAYDPYDFGAEASSYDPEDGRVIDAAIAGGEHALVTSNFRDFTERHDTIIAPGRVHIRHTANRDLYIVRPQEMVLWLRCGAAPVGPSGSNFAT